MPEVISDASGLWKVVKSGEVDLLLASLLNGERSSLWISNQLQGTLSFYEKRILDLETELKVERAWDSTIDPQSTNLHKDLTARIEDCERALFEIHKRISPEAQHLFTNLISCLKLLRLLHLSK